MLYLILLLPAALAVCCCVLRPDGGRARSAVLLAVQGAELLLVLLAVCRGAELVSPVWRMSEALTFSLRLDRLAGFFCLLTAACWLLTMVYALRYMTHEERQPRFYVFFFLTETMVLGTALAADFVTLYLFFEMTTLLSFPLVLHAQSDRAVLGASKYLYYSVAGAFLALFGIVVLASYVPLRFVQGGSLTSPADGRVLAASFCVILGLGAKAGLFPLHNWLPSAHPVAPAPASALLSGIITKIGVIGILRLIYFVVGADALRGTWVQVSAIILALITVFVGSYMGTTENVLKKRLAYSSVSQLSYVLLGVLLMTPAGLLGALLQMLFHAAAKIGVFLCAGSAIFLTGTETLDGFPGLGRRLPATMVCFTLLSLSLVGIPPFGGFFSKWYLISAALADVPGALGFVIAGVLLFSALLTAGYLFPPVVRSFFPGRAFPGAARVAEPLTMVLPFAVMAAVCLLLGLFPNGILTALRAVAGSIL